VRLSTFITDRRFLGAHFAEASWAQWRVALRALMGEPLGETDMPVWHQHTGRQQAPHRKFQRAAFICGRRSGKTKVSAALAVYLACQDWSKHLSAGEHGTVAVIASNRAQARNAFRYIRGMFKASPLLGAEIRSETLDSITLKATS
jgi:hypothetical protein